MHLFAFRATIEHRKDYFYSISAGSSTAFRDSCVTDQEVLALPMTDTNRSQHFKNKATVNIVPN